MKRRILTVSGPFLGLFILAATLPFTACDELDLSWTAVEDTVSLYSLARPELIGRESAYDAYSRLPVVVERPKSTTPFDFDFAVSELDGEFVLLPAGTFDGFDIEPGLAMDSSGVSFEEFDRAPGSGYVTDQAVPVRTDVLYAVKTRRIGACTRYGKMQILDVDPAGIVEFRMVRNSLCNDRELIPPDSD
jgi:hypothetical protein